MNNIKQKHIAISIIDTINLITKIKDYYFSKYKVNKLPDDLDEYCECILSYLISSGGIGNYWYVNIPYALEYHINKLIEYSKENKISNLNIYM